jgi:hypothetical protein
MKLKLFFESMGLLIGNCGEIKRYYEDMAVVSTMYKRSLN